MMFRLRIDHVDQCRTYFALHDATNRIIIRMGERYCEVPGIQMAEFDSYAGARPRDYKSSHTNFTD